MHESLPLFIPLKTWLESKPNIAAALLWQIQPGSGQNGAYDILPINKTSWSNWSETQKQDLVNAFNACRDWYFLAQSTPDDIDVIPVNISPTAPNAQAVCYISGTYAWELYVRTVAQSLFLEAYNLLPWSIQNYNPECLAILLDSSRIMRRLTNGTFAIGFDHYTYSLRREQLLGLTLPAAPRYTYNFAKQFIPEGFYQNKRLETIKNLLVWCKDNMSHYYGGMITSNCERHWQYSGPPPFAKVVEGTTALKPDGTAYGFSHWTAGCGGTSSFLVHALRALNIPVQIAVVCPGYHYLPLFPTEQVFMTHGDNPYNSDFKNSGLGIDSLLCAASEFEQKFGVDFSSPLNAPAASCANVGVQYLFQ